MVRFQYSMIRLSWRDWMKNKYRLSSTVFERERDEEKIQPQKIFFLAVEGNRTEKEYFQGISTNRMQLGIDALVDIKVLERSSKDTNCAPTHIIELLEEYLVLRASGEDDLLKDIPSEFKDAYGEPFIRAFLNNDSSITKKERNAFVTELKKIGYDIIYREYLSKYNNEVDEFGIVLDRDKLNHSETTLLECIKYCKEKHYMCYISNPCFEFWLLLHLSDVMTEYADKLDLIKENPKVSNRHTYVSNEVSQKAHHSKSSINFNQNYLPHVIDAIEQSKFFSRDEIGLVNEIGSNIGDLLEKMMEYN